MEQKDFGCMLVVLSASLDRLGGVGGASSKAREREWNVYSLHRLGGGGGVGEHRRGAYVPPSDGIHAKECV